MKGTINILLGLTAWGLVGGIEQNLISVGKGLLYIGFCCLAICIVSCIKKPVARANRNGQTRTRVSNEQIYYNTKNILFQQTMINKINNFNVIIFNNSTNISNNYYFLYKFQ